MTVIRQMTEADVPRCDVLRGLAGWNQLRQDWLRFIRWEPKGCFVAEAGDQILGTVTTTSYGTALAWIGMMLVHPEHRRKGIATQLMEKAVDYLKGQGVHCIRLDATPAGLPLYEKMGFV